MPSGHQWAGSREWHRSEVRYGRSFEKTSPHCRLFFHLLHILAKESLHLASKRFCLRPTISDASIRPKLDPAMTCSKCQGGCTCGKHHERHAQQTGYMKCLAIAVLDVCQGDDRLSIHPLESAQSFRLRIGNDISRYIS